MCYYTTNPQTMIQILQVAKDTTNVTKEVVSAIASGHTDLIIEKLIDMCISAGKNILIAIIVYIVGRFLISLIQRVMGNMLSRRKVEISIQTFLKSLVSILLNVLLIVSVVCFSLIFAKASFICVFLNSFTIVLFSTYCTRIKCDTWCNNLFVLPF